MNRESIMSIMYRILHKDYVEVSPKYIKKYKNGILVRITKQNGGLKGKRLKVCIIDDWKGRE